jgi:hypothetical protein
VRVRDDSGLETAAETIVFVVPRLNASGGR